MHPAVLPADRSCLLAMTTNIKKQKLRIDRETLVTLDPRALDAVNGGVDPDRYSELVTGRRVCNVTVPPTR